MSTAKMGNGAAAFYDFDGTLARGNLSIEFIVYLGKIGFYGRKLFEELQGTLTDYSSGKLSHDDFLLAYGSLWSRCLAGKKVADVERHAVEVFGAFTDNIYESSYGMISMMKAAGYHPIIVSVGAIEINTLAAKALDIEELYSTILEVKDGIYTGKIVTDLHEPSGKTNILQGMEGRFDLLRSFAFGDAIADGRMLEMVGNPVALNPTDQLRKLAEERGWHISTSDRVINDLAPLIKRNAKVKRKI